jgi:dTMP kinase
MNLNLFHPPTIAHSLFLSLEGIEGSGKSTQIKLIQHFLESKGMRCLVLREPGGTTFGEKLREAILSSSTPISPLAECHLFLASRAQLLHEKILPFLTGAPNSAVIVDRYMDSTLAYQGKARNLGLETVLELHQHRPLSMVPHRTYFLDIDLKTSYERQEKRGQSKDYFESEAAEFHQKLIEGYREVANLFKDRIHRIDAHKSEQEVSQEILKDLEGLLK